MNDLWAVIKSLVVATGLGLAGIFGPIFPLLFIFVIVHLMMDYWQFKYVHKKARRELLNKMTLRRIDKIIAKERCQKINQNVC